MFTATPAAFSPQPLSWQRLTSVSSDNLFEHMHRLTAWEQSYDQLSRGHFQGTLSEGWIGNLQVFEENLSQAVFQQGASREGTLALGVFSSLSEPARWRGVSMGFEHITCLSRQDALALSTPQHSTLLGLSVPLEVCATLRPQQDMDYLTELQAPLVQDPVLAHRFRGVLQQAFQWLNQADNSFQPQACVQHLHAELLDIVDVFINIALKTDLPISPAKARRVVQTARDYILAHPDQPLTITDLCAQTYTSRRTLQSCFEQVIGMSPAAYLKVIRLNGVRKDLLISGGALSVSDAAARWGFWHLSQFSLDYKRQFGELPSGTRQRGHTACH